MGRDKGIICREKYWNGTGASVCIVYGEYLSIVHNPGLHINEVSYKRWNLAVNNSSVPSNHVLVFGFGHVIL